MSKPRTDRETLAEFEAAMADDLLSSEMSEAYLDQVLAAAGADPAAVSKRGAALAADLLERRRLGWQDSAARRIAREADIVARRMKEFVDVPVKEVRRLLDAARTDPTAGGVVAAAFHKRKPEDASPEELRNLLAEIEALREIAALGDAEDDE